MELVDWHLITLFCALFVIIHGVSQSGYLDIAMNRLSNMGDESAQSVYIDWNISDIKQLVQQCAGHNVTHSFSGSS